MEKFINKLNLTDLTMEIIKVSSKGQVVIPEGVRKNLGIKQGSRLVLVEKGNDIILKREKDAIKQLKFEAGKEEIGWLALAERSLKDIWENKKDEKTWKQYL